MKMTGLNFIEAVKAAEKGFAVKRRNWESLIVMTTYREWGWADGTTIPPLTVHFDDYLADDWEIVRTKDLE